MLPLSHSPWHNGTSALEARLNFVLLISLSGHSGPKGPGRMLSTELPNMVQAVDSRGQRFTMLITAPESKQILAQAPEKLLKRGPK